MDYASEEGLPLKLFSSSGDVYDSASDDYNSVEDYKNGSKETSGVLSLSAQDIHVNTQIIDKKLRQPGDLIILTRPANHIVNVLDINPTKLIYGNLKNGKPTSAKITDDWSNITAGGYKYFPDNKHVHRWKMFK